MSTHYQFWQFTLEGKVGIYVHQGIDISACAREPVYAVESGTVVFSNFRDKVDGQYKELIISRGPDDSQGIRYLHLGGARVTVGDKVERDQMIGTIVNWLEPCSYDHLHMQVVAIEDPTWTTGNPWPKSSVRRDVINPLTVFASEADKDLPAGNSVSTAFGSGAVDLLFFNDDSVVELSPTDLKGSIDIVASLRDQCFDDPANCSSSASCTEVISKDVAPYKFELRISKLDTAGGTEGTRELFSSFQFTEGITSSLEYLAKLYYHDQTSVGTHGERDLRFNLTNSGSGGAWVPDAGDYKIYVRAEDLAGNAFEVPPVQVKVAGP